MRRTCTARFPHLALAVLAGVGLVAPHAPAEVCGGAVQVAPVPTTAHLAGVASGDGLTVAVGEQGTIIASTDGLHWTARPSPTTADLEAVAHGNGTWVAVGENGVVVTSNDAIAWTTGDRLTQDGSGLIAVTWAMGRFVALSSGDTIATSLDGRTWTVTAARLLRLRSVAGNDSILVAVGDNGGPLLSTDGITWAVGTNSQPKLTAVGWGGGQFVAVGPGRAFTSPDGRTWTLTSNVPAGGRFVTRLGSTWLTTSATSPDGVSWTQLEMPQVTDVSWDGQKAIGVGYNGLVVTSSDLATWIDLTVFAHDVASDGASYVVAGGPFLWSADGVAWAAVPTAPALSAARVAAHPGGYLAVGQRVDPQTGTVVAASPDGRSWGAAVEIPLGYPTGLAWGGGRFVVVDWRGGVAVSTDGATWAVHPTGTLNLCGVVWDGQRFVAGALVDVPGTMSTPAFVASADGQTWERISGATPPGEACGLARAGRSFYTLGRGPAVSADLLGWRPAFLDLGGEVQAVSGAGPGVVAVGGTRGGDARDAFAAWSSDGVRFVAEPLPDAPSVLYAVAAGPGGYVAVGSFNTIYHGTCGGNSAVIPTAGHLPGAAGTLWRTDLAVTNLGPTRSGFSLALLERGQANPAPESRSFTLDPGLSATYPDVVAGVFGHEGAGALRLTFPSGADELATSRTYNQTPNGTYGQDVPAIPETDAIAEGRIGLLPGLAESAAADSGSRTNLGLVNLAPVAITVAVSLYDASGHRLGGVDVTLRPGEPKQLDRVLRTVTQTDVVGAYATVASTTPSARFVAYASIVDNRSGDPVLVVAR